MNEVKDKNGVVLQVGDRVKAKRGETCITGRIDRAPAGMLYVREVGYSVGGLINRGYEITLSHRPKPPKPKLPTTPGLYRVNRGNHDTVISSYRRVMLTTNGQWYWVDFTNSLSPTSKVSDTDEFAADCAEQLVLVYGGAA